jgi:hypothetical protein
LTIASAETLNFDSDTWRRSSSITLGSSMPSSSARSRTLFAVIDMGDALVEDAIVRKDLAWAPNATSTAAVSYGQKQPVVDHGQPSWRQSPGNHLCTPWEAFQFRSGFGFDENARRQL